MVLTPGEIKTLLEGLKIREKTLVFIAASTGIRQSELFALKWSDIDLSAGTMNMVRSIVHGIVGPCKTESSQKPVPIHPLVIATLDKWRSQSSYRGPDDWVFASRHSQGRLPYWGQAILRRYLRPAARELGIEKRFGWHTFRHTYSTLLRSVGTRPSSTEFTSLRALLQALLMGQKPPVDVLTLRCAADLVGFWPIIRQISRSLIHLLFLLNVPT